MIASATLPKGAYAEVIGDPIAQSKSPMIHGFWLEKLGLKADYRVQRVSPHDLADYLAERKSDPAWLGCNVTMPLKQDVPALVDNVEPPADIIGAVNTVYRSDNDSLVGTNTDAAGFLEPLRAILGKEHYFRMARIIGTGGAARAIVAALANEGFTIVLAGRNPAKARAILDQLAPHGEHHTPPIDHFAGPNRFRIR